MKQNPEHSLIVTHHGKPFFCHDGNWLHPLFELEVYLSENNVDPRELEATDKIVGKAAAMLMVRMGLCRVHAMTLSRPGLAVFRAYRVEVSYDRLVPLIDCGTEKILGTIDDPEEASIFLLRRGKRDVDAALIIESLYVSRGGRQILENLSFAVTRGERVVIKGDNGTGKTTLLETVLGEVKIDSGHIEIGGSFSKRVSPDLLGYLGQYTSPGEIAVTAREVLSLGAMRWKEDAAEQEKRISEAVSITGIEFLLKRPMNTLSGGERRRVDLTRCFIQAPLLLLLDEPTANLDERSRGAVITILDTYASLHRSAIVMVTHDESVLHLSGWRCHELKNGRLFTVPASGAEEQ